MSTPIQTRPIYVPPGGAPVGNMPMRPQFRPAGPPTPGGVPMGYVSGPGAPRPMQGTPQMGAMRQGYMGPPPGATGGPGGSGMKRPLPSGGPMGSQMFPGPQRSFKKKKRLADKILPQKVRELVPESQAYMDLLSFERKLDSTIMTKRLDIQEALKRPMKRKRKLHLTISNTAFPAKEATEATPGGPPAEEATTARWELRVEGKLVDDENKPDPGEYKRKFSSFFNTLIIELDKDLYGPENNLAEWRRTKTTHETDGFEVKRPGNRNIRCTILLTLNYQPMQFKLDERLARILSIHTQTRPAIISALWQYIKTHKLQDPHEHEFINCDALLKQIFRTERLKFTEIPTRLNALLQPPDPIVINHLINVEDVQSHDIKKTALYDLDVEVDDTLMTQMNSFLLSTASQQEIQALDNKIHETVETIKGRKTSREFFMSFAKNPQLFINKWLISQSKDLKTMTDVAGDPEEERHTDFYYQPWAQEAVCRYFYQNIQRKRAELDLTLGAQNN